MDGKIICIALMHIMDMHIILEIIYKQLKIKI